MQFLINDVVQFNENHKWCGCLGMIIEIKGRYSETCKYLVGIPTPEKGTAYAFAENYEIEYIGKAVLGLLLSASSILEGIN